MTATTNERAAKAAGKLLDFGTVKAKSGRDYPGKKQSRASKYEERTFKNYTRKLKQRGAFG